MSGVKTSRLDAAFEAAKIAAEDLSKGELLDIWEQLFREKFGHRISRVVELEQLRLTREIHAAVTAPTIVLQPGERVEPLRPAEEILRQRARAVVDERYYDGDDGWDRLKAAIGNLEDLVGRTDG